MRAFLALELPVEVRQALAVLARELAASQADVKWVEEANLHVTMRFLGEISDEQRQAVEQLLGRVAQRTAPFQVSLASLGAFPSMNSPRVVWVGVEQGKPELAKIAADLEGGLAGLGFSKEDRAFTAHITLGRVRSPRNRPQLVEALKTATWTPPPPFPADHLTLFQSTLSSTGSIYTPLVRAPLSLN